MNKTSNILLLLAMLLFCACSDDHDILPPDDSMNLTCSTTEIESRARYHTLRIEGLPEGTGTYEVQLSDEWAEIENCNVGTDGIIELWTEENTDPRSRVLGIKITNIENPAMYGNIEILQKGTGDNEDNSENDPRKEYCLGWGMNAYDEYQDSESTRGRVFDLNKMALLDKEDGFQNVQEVVRAHSEFTTVSATSEREMSSILTKRFDKSSNFLGVKKTMRRYSEITSQQSSQKYCAYARLTKVVASRSLDAGAILYMVDSLPAEKMPFSKEFAEAYAKIVKAKNNNSKEIAEMLDQFGTHVVIEANAGGMIDYTGAFDRERTENLEAVTEEQSKRVFGKSSSSYSESLKHSLISNISNSASVKIKGGSAELRKKLYESLNTLDNLGVIPNTLLNEWAASIKYSETERQNLDIVDFRVIPIWKLFSDDAVSQQIMLQVIKMQEQSNNIIPDQELGTDNYRISLDDDRLNFTNTSDPATTLVKTYYVNKVPVMEMCEEYVPKISSNRRIKVYYPIHNGKTNHGQGLFPGDGEGNRPASLVFYGGECFVTPLEEFGTREQLTDIYYIHGSLYEKDYGKACGTPKDTQVLDDKLQFSGWKESYSIVKIGSGYWTRQYIKEEMQFGTGGKGGGGGRFKQRERIDGGLLFADVYQGNKNGFLETNKGIYGPDMEPYSDMQTLWYLPLTRNLEDLKKYLGGNMKTLFKGQPSGFEAQFEGYYGSYDEHGNSLGTTQRRMKNERCYVAFKGTATTSVGKVIALLPNYKWIEYDTSLGFNYYPVRLYRTSFYIHNNL